MVVTKASLILLTLLLSMLTFLPHVHAQVPPLPSPRYRYAFIDDPNLSGRYWATDSWMPKSTLTGGPAQGWTTSFFLNNKWYGTANQEDGDAWISATANQGFDVETFKILGGNTSRSDAVPTDGVVFPLNETIPSDTYYLYVRAKIVNRYQIDPAPTAFWGPAANLGLGFVFQYEYIENGQYKLSEYRDPDFWRVDYQVAYTEIFLSCWMPWLYPTTHHAPVGAEKVNIATLYDRWLHASKTYGEMRNHGVMYYFKIDFGDFIEWSKTTIKDWTEGWYNNTATDYILRDLASYDPSKIKDITVTSIILRNVQLYVEAVGAYIEAVVDYALIDTTDPFFALDVYAQVYNNPGSSLATSVYLDGDFYGKTPIHFRGLYEGWWEISVSTYVFKFYEGSNEWSVFEFERWTDGNTNEIRSVYLTGPSIYTAEYRRKYTYYTYGAFGGGGDGSTPRPFSPPPEHVTSANLNQTTPTYLDDSVFVKMRTSLNNTFASFNLAISAYHKTIDVDAVGIEKIDIDLGEIWADSPYMKSWFGLVTAPMDDVTLYIWHDNVTRFDLTLKNVPSVLSVKHNGIPFNEEQWNYTDGNLYIRLYPWDHSEIFIDFETPYSLTYSVLIQSSVVLIAMLTVVWLYRKLKTL